MGRVGTKAVNALSEIFIVESSRDKETKKAKFEYGDLIVDSPIEASNKRRGTKVFFIPDGKIFKNYKYRREYVERMIKNYVYLNLVLQLILIMKNFILKMV